MRTSRRKNEVHFIKMKILSVVLLLLLGYNSYAQTSGNNKTSNDLIKEFTWDVQKEEKRLIEYPLSAGGNRCWSNRLVYLTIYKERDAVR